MSRLGARLSPQLRAEIESASGADGDISAVVRALLLLGLHAAGRDVSPLLGDLQLGKVVAADIRAAVQQLFNVRSTHVEHPAARRDTSLARQDAAAGSAFAIGEEF